jgi:hypothetical protein
VRPGGGKFKGASYERAAGKELSNWLTYSARGDIFTRNVLSGGKFTNSLQAGRKEGIPGDLMAAHPIAYDFLSHFLVECKHYANLNFEAFLFDRKRKSFLWTVLSHTKEQALHAELEWIIVAKQNRRPSLVLLDPKIAALAMRAMTTVKGLTYHVVHNRACGIMDLDNFLKADPKKFMASVKGFRHG